MSNKTQPVTVSELLQFFPEVELPVVFTDETLNVFSQENPPLPNTIVQTVIAEWEGALDDYTEVIPCVLVDSNEDYHAFVYWKGGLLQYEFILVTIMGEYSADQSQAFTMEIQTTGDILFSFND